MAKKASQTPSARLRDRIVDFRRVAGTDILPHPYNPRGHPATQRERLRALLDEIGIAGALIAYHSNRNAGALTLIDGELRATEAPDVTWPCLVLDVDDAEADLLIATLDPIAAMAEYTRRDHERALYESLTTGHPILQTFLSDLATHHKLLGTPAPLPLHPPSPGDFVVDADGGTAYVRMVQLFLNIDTFPLFQRYVDALERLYGTENPTDTVMECLRRAYDTLDA